MIGFARRLCAALGLAVLVLFVPGAAAWATVEPTAEPSGSVPVSEPTPEASPSTEPLPTPEPSNSEPPAPSSDVPPSVVVLAPEQYDVLSFGVGLLVFLNAAAFVAAWKS